MLDNNCEQILGGAPTIRSYAPAPYETRKEFISNGMARISSFF